MQHVGSSAKAFAIKTCAAAKAVIFAHRKKPAKIVSREYQDLFAYGPQTKTYSTRQALIDHLSPCRVP
jgi:hypothetical protein